LLSGRSFFLLSGRSFFLLSGRSFFLLSGRSFFLLSGRSFFLLSGRSFFLLSGGSFFLLSGGSFFLCSRSLFRGFLGYNLATGNFRRRSTGNCFGYLFLSLSDFLLNCVRYLCRGSFGGGLKDRLESLQPHFEDSSKCNPASRTKCGGGHSGL